MNTKVKLCVALLSTLFSLYACSKGQIDEPAIEHKTQHMEEASRITLTLEAGMDAPRAMNYKIDGSNLPKVHLTAKTIPVHCIVRSDNPTDPASYATLNFNVVGTKALRLDLAQMSLRVDTKTFSPEAGRKWYLMAIIGGELDKATGRVKFDSSATPLKRIQSGSEVSIDVPYISQWIPLELRRQSDGSYDAGGIDRLHFKPQGVLLRIQARNNLPVSHIQVYGYRIRSYVADSKGSFDLNTSVGQAPKWSYSDPTTGWDRTYKLETPTLDMPAQTTDDAYHLLWMMPNGSKSTGYSVVTITEATIRDRVSERQTHAKEELFTTLQIKEAPIKHALRQGTCVTIRPEIEPGWDPLNQMGTWNYSGEYPHTTQSRSNSNHIPQFYNYVEATEIAKKESGWRLPTIYDWMAILGDISVAGEGALNFDALEEYKLNNPEDVQEGSQKRVIHSDYKKDYGSQRSYGVRFRATEHSRSYTAWRYSIEPNPKGGGSLCFIKSVYLGPGAHEVLKDISSEDWWNKNRARVNIRRLPLTGKYSPSHPKHPQNIGLEGSYWTSTPYSNEGNHYICGIDRLWGNNHGTPPTSNYASVRLFRNM